PFEAPAGEGAVEGIGPAIGPEALHAWSKGIRRDPAVQHGHPVPLRQQSKREVMPDEPGASDEQDIHRRHSPWVVPHGKPTLFMERSARENGSPPPLRGGTAG